MPGGGTKAARLPADSAAAAGSAGTAATRESTVSMPSPTRRVAPSPAGALKRTAWPWTRPSALRGWGGRGLGGAAGVKPSALHAFERPARAGDGGDEGGGSGASAHHRGRRVRNGSAAPGSGRRRGPGRGGRLPPGSRREGGRRATGAVRGGRRPRMQAGPARAASGSLCAHHRQGEEGAGLVEGGAKRPGADAAADEVEEGRRARRWRRRSTCRAAPGGEGARTRTGPGRRRGRRRPQYRPCLRPWGR